MRSLITYCYLKGCSQWAIAANFVDSPFYQALRSADIIDTTIAPTAQSAAFYALGNIMGNDVITPAAVLVSLDRSSIEALRPALKEASLQALPLLVISVGDVPPSEKCIFCEYGDTLLVTQQEQLSSHLLDEWNFQGPLHMHIATGILHAEPFNALNHTDLDLEADYSPTIKYPPLKVGDLARVLRFEAHDGIVLMIGNLPPEDRDAALWLAQTLNAPVIADATSCIREKLEHLLVSDPEYVFQKVGLNSVLRLGGIPSSPVWKKLEDMPETKVFSLSRSPEKGLNRHSSLIMGTMDDIVEAMGDVSSIGDPTGILTVSRKRKGKIEELLLSHTESAQAMLNAISEFASVSESLYLSDHRLLNLWNDVAQKKFPNEEVFSHLDPDAANGRLSCLLGIGSKMNSSWAVINDIKDIGELEELEIIQNRRDYQFVLVSIDLNQEPSAQKKGELEKYAQNNAVRHLSITSSFDLEMLEGIGSEGVTIVEITPDYKQTSAFCKAMELVQSN